MAAEALAALSQHLANLEDDESLAVSLIQTRSQLTAQLSWNVRAASFLQEASTACDPIKDPNCSAESTKVLFLLISLCATITLVICAFSFFREDREEQITPLCPQLVVKDTELKFTLPALPLFTQVDSTNNMDVTDKQGNIVCKISMDWPDPFRGSPHGVAATVRIHKSDMTLATIVARNVAVLGQGLALCRTGCEIFGFVEPEGNRYIVRHRTGVHLLTLIGSFGPDTSLAPEAQQDIWDIEGVNPVGSKVCSMKKVGNECVGKVTQHVDAGLVICAIMATYVHRRLSQPWSAKDGDIARPMSAIGAGGEIEDADTDGQATVGTVAPPIGGAAGSAGSSVDVTALRSPPHATRPDYSPPYATREVLGSTRDV